MPSGRFARSRPGAPLRGEKPAPGGGAGPSRPAVASRFRAREERLVPAAGAAACLLFYLGFLVHYGDMFYWGSDVVVNTAYGVTLFSGVLKSGWTVPKPAEMFLLGTIYRLFGDLRAIHVAFIVATALTAWAGCRLILRHFASTLACAVFVASLIALPHVFRATLIGGPGVLSTVFLLLAVLSLSGMRARGESREPAGRGPFIASLVFLALANLARPDCWPATLLLVCAFVLMERRERAPRRWAPSDLWFLVPLAMPLVWIAVGAIWFGDPMYSMNIARDFVAEAASEVGPAADPQDAAHAALFLPHLQAKLFQLFSIARPISLATLIVLASLVLGAREMIRRNARIALLSGCPIAGTLGFYYLYALRGMLFRPDYIYAVLIFALLAVSVGLAVIVGPARKLPLRGLRPALPYAIAAVLLALWLAAPVKKETAAEMLPVLKMRATQAKWSRAAVERVAEDVRESRATPIILGTQWIPPSRIALELGTGKDIYLAERVIGKLRTDEGDVLPDHAGRTVYYCFIEPPPQGLADYLRPLIEGAASREILFRQEGLLVYKCKYDGERKSMPRSAYR